MKLAPFAKQISSNRRKFSLPSHVGPSAVAVAAMLLLSRSAQAQTIIDWSATAPTTAWATGTNWIGGNAPANDVTTNIARFDQTSYTSQPDAGTRSIAGINIGDGTTATAVLTLAGTNLSIGDSGITMFANAGAATISSSITIAGSSNNLTIINNSASLLTMSGTIGLSGTGKSVTVGGTGANGSTGTVSWTGSSNTALFTGGLTVNSGTLLVNKGTNALGVGGTVQLGDTTAGNTNSATLDLTSTVVVSNPITINAGSSGTLTLTSATSSTAGLSGAIALNNKLTVDATNGISRTLTLSGPITGSANITKGTGNGIVSITGANGSSYTGNTTINGGTLSFTNGALGTGTITFGNSSTLQWGASNTQDISSKLQSIGSAVTATLDVGANNVTLATVNGLTGGGKVTKAGTGTLTLSNANNHTGGTTISVGTIAVGNDAALGTGPIAFSNTIASTSTGLQSTDATTRNFSNALGTFGGSTATYTFGATSGGTGALNFNNTTSSSIGTGARTFAVNVTTTFANPFSGSGAITKTGGGTMVLNGASTNTGVLTVSAGTLLANGVGTGTTSSATGTATSTVTVTGGSTLGGTGRILGATTIGSTTVAGGANITGGTNGAVGMLTLLANTTFTGVSGSVSNYQVDLNGATADQLAITGNLDLSTTFDTLTLNLINPPTLSSYAIVTFTGSVTGTFDNPTLPAGYSLSYGAHEIDLVVTTVPEPSTWMAGCLSLGLAGFVLNKRRRGVKPNDCTGASV